MFPPLSHKGHASSSQLGTFQVMFTQILSHSGLKDSYETNRAGRMGFHVTETRTEIHGG